MSGIRWGEALSKGLMFSVHPKRWLPLLAIDSVFFFIMAQILINNIDMVGAAVVMMSSNAFSVIPFLGMFMLLALTIALWNLVRLWAIGSIIHQCRKEKEGLAKCYMISARKYPHLVGVAAIGAFFGIIATMVPDMSYIINMIVGLVLFFAMQEVIIGKKGFTKAVKGSWEIFQKNPVRILLMWLIITTIAGLIMLVFLLPLIVSLMVIMLPYYSSMGESYALMSSLTYLLNNIEPLILQIALAMIGFAAVTVFILKATTEYYLQSRKRLRI